MSRLRILLDECIDRRLARELPEHDVKTVPQMGWAGLKNGNLLTEAQKAFDIFLTVDRNLSFQQNLPSYDIAVIVLHAKTNRLQAHIPLISQVQTLLANPKPGSAVAVRS